MIQDRFRKKTKNPPSGGKSSLDMLTEKTSAPQIEDVLAEIDKALEKADRLEYELNRPLSSCGCGGH
jgi:hypothetical protein